MIVDPNSKSVREKQLWQLKVVLKALSKSCKQINIVPQLFRKAQNTSRRNDVHETFVHRGIIIFVTNFFSVSLLAVR